MQQKPSKRLFKSFTRFLGTNPKFLKDLLWKMVIWRKDSNIWTMKFVRSTKRFSKRMNLFKKTTTNPRSLRLFSNQRMTPMIPILTLLVRLVTSIDTRLKESKRKEIGSTRICDKRVLQWMVTNICWVPPFWTCPRRKRRPKLVQHLWVLHPIFLRVTLKSLKMDSLRNLRNNKRNWLPKSYGKKSLVSWKAKLNYFLKSYRRCDVIFAWPLI